MDPSLLLLAPDWTPPTPPTTDLFLYLSNLLPPLFLLPPPLPPVDTWRCICCSRPLCWRFSLYVTRRSISPLPPPFSRLVGALCDFGRCLIFAFRVCDFEPRNEERFRDWEWLAPEEEVGRLSNWVWSGWSDLMLTPTPPPPVDWGGGDWWRRRALFDRRDWIVLTYLLLFDYFFLLKNYLRLLGWRWHRAWWVRLWAVQNGSAWWLLIFVFLCSFRAVSNYLDAFFASFPIASVLF